MEKISLLCLGLSMFIFIFFTDLQALTAQKKLLFSRDYWHKGELTLNSGEEIPGLLKYLLNENLIQIMDSDKRLRVFPCFQVKNFYFKDSLTKVYRNFYTLPADNLGFVSRYAFFELLHHGDVSLFSREKIRLVPSRSPTQPKWINQFVYSFGENFYLMNHEGKITFYKQVHDLSTNLKINENFLNNMIKENELDLKKRKDYIYLMRQVEFSFSKQENTPDDLQQSEKD